MPVAHCSKHFPILALSKKGFIIMALANVLKGTTKEGEPKTSRYVGMKLKNEDADELGALYGLPAGTPGTTIFKTMVAAKLEENG